MKSRLVTAGVFLLALAFAIGVAEGVARLVIPPADFLQTEVILDPVLGHRIASKATGHDALGLRNRKVPEQAAIVAIGDSMTYGFGVPGASAWPQQLGTLRKETTYNMGLGGYGPLQYLQRTRDAAEQFKPRQLVVGFYFGNDLMDAYYVSRSIAHWKGWRTTAQDVPEESDAVPGAAPAEPPRRFHAAREWLAHNSLLYALLKATLLQHAVTGNQADRAKQLTPDELMPWRDPAAPAIGTMFTPQMRLATEDLSLPKPAEGLRLTQRAFAEMKDEADRRGVALLVVLIPTRERVYCPYLKRSGATLPPSFAKLCDAEEAVKAELLRGFAAKGIRHVDVTGALEAQVAAHVQVYPAHTDGHPTPAGHLAIARAVNDALAR